MFIEITDNSGKVRLIHINTIAEVSPHNDSAELKIHNTTGSYPFSYVYTAESYESIRTSLRNAGKLV